MIKVDKQKASTLLLPVLRVMIKKDILQSERYTYDNAEELVGILLDKLEEVKDEPETQNESMKLKSLLSKESKQQTPWQADYRKGNGYADEKKSKEFESDIQETWEDEKQIESDLINFIQLTYDYNGPDAVKDVVNAIGRALNATQKYLK